MFADDTKVYTPIHHTLSSTQSLQTSLDHLHNWSKKWELSFNESKCHILTVQKQNSHNHNYTFGSNTLEHVITEKDLGITVDSTLIFKVHVQNISSKANQIVGMIKHNFYTFTPKVVCLLYKSLNRPTLEYGSCVWSPNLAYLQAQLEQVQHRATKLIPELAVKPYEERLKLLKLPSLSYRRAREDMIQVYKLLHHLYNIDPSLLLTLSKSHTRSNGLKLDKKHCNTSLRLSFFTQRVVNRWNSLPSVVVMAPSLDSFKNRLDNHWEDKKYDEVFES